MSLEFPGKERFLARIDEAVSADCPFEITTCLRKALCRCIEDEQIRLPEVVYQPVEGHYARREIHQDPKRGYSVIAMTWGPGQGTPIHDHDGMWCVEGVWNGCIEVVNYQLLDREQDRYNFEEVGSIVAGCGSAGSLIPPHEYHTIANPSDDEVAVSVHIYAGPMVNCGIFERTENGWHVRRVAELSLDD